VQSSPDRNPAENKHDLETALHGDQSGSAEITDDGTNGADRSQDLCDVHILPPPPLSHVAHAAKLAAFVEELLSTGRPAVAVGVVRALRKVLAKAEASSSADESDAILDARSAL
jgi:hypothetical protein